MISLLWILLWGAVLLMVVTVITETVDAWNSFTFKEEWELVKWIAAGKWRK